MVEKILVSVNLSKDTLDMFRTLKKHYYMTSDAELMRMCLRKYYDQWLKEREDLEEFEKIKKELGDELDKQVSK